MTDEDVKDSPNTALAYCADKLTPEQLDYCKEKTKRPNEKKR